MKKNFLTALIIVVSVVVLAAAVYWRSFGFGDGKVGGHTLTVDYGRLNSLPAAKPLDIVELNSIPATGYVEALRVADLYGDGRRELVYLEDNANEGKLKIADANGQALAACDVGQSTNQYYYLAVDDLNHDGRPEIITAGGHENEVRQLALKYRLGDAIWSNDDPVRVEFRGDDAGSSAPALLADLDQFTKVKYESAVSADGKTLTLTMSKNDYAILGSEDYSLIINDSHCHELARYKIADDILGAGFIYAKDLGPNEDKEIVFKAVYSGKDDGVYVERGGAVAKSNDQALVTEAQAKMDAEKYPLSEALAAKFKIGADSLVGDLNGDGRDEIVVFVAEPGHGSAVVQDAIFVLDQATGELLWKLPYAQGIYDEFRVLGDINNDGAMEIIAGGRFGSSIEIFGLKK